MSSFINWPTIILGCLQLFFLTGCVSMDSGEGEYSGNLFATVLNSSPKVSLFISLKSDKGLKIAAQLNAVELFDGEKWVLLNAKPIKIDAATIGSGQSLAIRSNISPGNYSKIRFSVIDPVVAGRENTTLPEIVQPGPQSLSPTLAVDENDSTSLFMSWDTDASVEEQGGRFQAKIQTSVQTIPITSELAYVSCPAINTIYIIRTDTNRVTGSWGVSGYPSHLAVYKENDELYVLADQESAIKVIELSSGRLKDTVKIPLVNNPFFMVGDSDGQNAFVLDRSSNHVSRIDMNSGSLAGRVRPGEELGSIIYLAERHQLAVTSPMDQKVFIIDARNLNILETIAVGSRPTGMLRYNNKLYVAESGAGTIMSFNLNTSEVERSHVGSEPQQFAEQDDYIYVSNHDDGTVSVLLPGQLSVVKKIRVGGTPARMSNSSFRNWLYVNDSRGGKINVIDLTSHRVAANIELKTEPLDVEIIK